MNADRQNYLRTRLGKRETAFAVWRWTAASEFGAECVMSVYAGGFDFQSGMTPRDMRALALALQQCAADCEAEAAAQQVAA